MYTIAKPSSGNSASPASTTALVDGPYTPEVSFYMAQFTWLCRHGCVCMHARAKADADQIET